MALDRVHRELAVILHADVAGYSRLMEWNEDVVHQRVTECFDRLTCVIEQFRGTVTERRGDAVLARFDRPSDGVLAAASYQRSERELLEARDGPCPQVRIGLNLGEVIADQGTLWGTGVNLAQRVEQLAEPGAICVSSTVRDAISKALPIEYDDLGEQWVKDTRLHAYRARLRAGEDIISPPPASAAQVAAPIFDKPSLTVLPFVNVGGDPEQEYFADGVTEHIIGAMSHLRWLFVVGRNSAFTYKGKATDVRQVGRELGVRYVVEGSVRRSGDRVRVSVSLNDCQDGQQIWADRYDRPMRDVFDLQDEIARNVATAVEPTLYDSESARIRHKPTSDLDSWDCYLQAMARYYRGNRTDNAAAQELAERAIDLDPSNSRAFYALSASRHRASLNGWCQSRGRMMSSARDAAERAIQLDESDARSHHQLGLLRFAYADHDAALSEEDRALELNPSFAWAYAAKAAILAYCGEPEKALPLFDVAVKASPLDPNLSYWQCARSLTYFMLGDFQRAIDCASYSIGHHAEWLPSRVFITATYGLAGQQRLAEQALRDLQSIEPNYTISKAKTGNPFKHATDFERFAEGLRRAGLPEA